MKRLSLLLVSLGVAILIFVNSIFGVSVLNNLHLSYLRNLGKDVVLIHNLTGSGATGFLVKGKSGKIYIMTNNHVCGLEKSGTILVNYRGDTYVSEVVKRYPMNDLCVMSAPGTATKVFGIARSYTLGETASAIGHPLLEPLSLSSGELSDTITVTITIQYNGTKEECSGPTYTYHEDDLPLIAKIFGINTACTRSVEANTSSIVIQPGNSGSPITNIWGNVVGVVFAANESGTRSYAVPLHDLKSFLDTL